MTAGRHRHSRAFVCAKIEAVTRDDARARATEPNRDTEDQAAVDQTISSESHTIAAATSDRVSVAHAIKSILVMSESDATGSPPLADAPEHRSDAQTFDGPTAAAADTEQTRDADGRDDDEDEDEEDELSFQPTLRSDVTADLSFKLLQSIASSDVAYRDFTSSDLRKLSKVLSVLSVSRGDAIIAKGEEASFCGIVLDGCFQAVVTPTLSVDLRRGALVGEMALFEGGFRNADIRCSEEAVLAVITFAELNELGTTFPILQRRLFFLFASASLRKLRKMSLTPTQAAELAKKDAEEVARVKAAKAAPGGRGGAAATAPPPKKKEFLYRSRIEAASVAAAAASAESKSVERRATMRVDRERVKREKAEKDSKYDKLRYENAQRKIEKYNALLDRLEEQLEAAQSEINKKDATLAILEREKEELEGQLVKSQSTLESESSGRTAADTKLARAMEAATREAEARYEPLLAHARDELTRVRAETETNAQHLKKTTEEHLKLLDANRQMQETVGGITSVRNTLYSELYEEKKKREATETIVLEKEKQVLELKAASRALELRLTEAEEQRVALLPWKQKALDLQHGVELEKRMSAREVEDALRGKVELEEDVRRYQKLLKLVVVGTYCRESRLRKSLASTHERVSDMLLTAMEENIGSGGAGANAAAANKLHSGQHQQQHPRTSFKAIKKRKKAYITLLKSRSKPREIVASLDEEVVKLRAPVEELIHSAKHWQLTSESFFQRNIQLTTEKDEVEAAARKTLTKLESIRAMLKTNQTEHEEMVNRNADLTKTNHALKLEVDRLQNKYGVLATQSAAAVDKVGGGGDGGGGGDSSVSSRKAAKHAKAAQAIEQLQLRQQDVLQHNIQRLQQHYNHLLASIQGLNQAVGVQRLEDGTLSASPSMKELGLAPPSRTDPGATTGASPDEKQSSIPVPPAVDSLYQSLDAWVQARGHQPVAVSNASGVSGGDSSRASSTANLHHQHQIQALHTTYSAAGVPAARQPGAGPVPPPARAHGVATTAGFASPLRSVQPVPPSAAGLAATYAQPSLHALSPASQRAYQDHHRQLYNQAVGKAASPSTFRAEARRTGPLQANVPIASAAADDAHTIRRLEGGLFHLPQMAQPPVGGASPPQQAQTHRSSPSTTSLTGAPANRAKTGAQTSRRP